MRTISPFDASTALRLQKDLGSAWIIAACLDREADAELMHGHVRRAEYLAQQAAKLREHDHAQR